MIYLTYTVNYPDFFKKYCKYFLSIFWKYWIIHESIILYSYLKCYFMWLWYKNNYFIRKIFDIFDLYSKYSNIKLNILQIFSKSFLKILNNPCILNTCFIFKNFISHQFGTKISISSVRYLIYLTYILNYPIYYKKY